MRYSDINTELRKLINAAKFEYLNKPMKKLYLGQWDDDSGPHVRVLFHENTPDARELGFEGYQSNTGYIQVGFFVPATDRGINYSLADLSQQLADQIKRGNIENTSSIKLQITSVERGDNVRIGGHFANTSRVNFTVGHCD